MKKQEFNQFDKLLRQNTIVEFYLKMMIQQKYNMIYDTTTPRNTIIL